MLFALRYQVKMCNMTDSKVKYRQLMVNLNPVMGGQ